MADFAAAALKFRTEMADMKFADEGGGAGEDMMERLLREQNGDLEDDDAMPDWAADGEDSTLDLGFGKSQPLEKRSLLLEVRPDTVVDTFVPLTHFRRL